MRSFDSNNNSILDDSDSNYQTLLLWIDRNSDGLSASDELISLADAGIASIDLAIKSENENILGNSVTGVGQATGSAGNTIEFAVVDFASLTPVGVGIDHQQEDYSAVATSDLPALIELVESQSTLNNALLASDTDSRGEDDSDDKGEMEQPVIIDAGATLEIGYILDETGPQDVL